MGVRAARARLPRGLSRALHQARRSAHLRRGHHRLPRRLGRRAGALRRAARPHDAGQDHRRRPAGRRLRRPPRHHGDGGAAGLHLPGRHAVGQSAGDGSRGGHAARPRGAGRLRASRDARTRCRGRPHRRRVGGGPPVHAQPRRPHDDAVLLRGAGAQFRRREAGRHRAVRRLLAAHARERHLPGAVAVRGDDDLPGPDATTTSPEPPPRPRRSSPAEEGEPCATSTRRTSPPSPCRAWRCTCASSASCALAAWSASPARIWRR